MNIISGTLWHSNQFVSLICFAYGIPLNELLQYNGRIALISCTEALLIIGWENWKMKCTCKYIQQTLHNSAAAAAVVTNIGNKHTNLNRVTNTGNHIHQRVFDLFVRRVLEGSGFKNFSITLTSHTTIKSSSCYFEYQDNFTGAASSWETICEKQAHKKN